MSLEISQWVRLVYDVSEPFYQDVGNVERFRGDGMVRAYDRASGALVGEWEEGGYLPVNLYAEYMKYREENP